MRCGVSLPDFPRRVLMESVHEIVEFGRVDIATFPTIELDAKLTQGFAQFSIMRDSRPFSNETLDSIRDFLHFVVGGFAWLTSRMSRTRSQVNARRLHSDVRRLAYRDEVVRAVKTLCFVKKVRMAA